MPKIHLLFLLDFTYIFWILTSAPTLSMRVHLPVTMSEDAILDRMRRLQLSDTATDATAVDERHISSTLEPSTPSDTASVVYIHGSGPRDDDTIRDISTAAVFGVYWGDDDPRNMSRSAQGPIQTQHLAILQAFVHVLTISRYLPGRLEICTTSQYAVRACSTWRSAWINNGWKTSKKQPVKHQALLKEILALEHLRVGPTIYRHISCSDAVKGRIEAVKLAASALRRHI